MLYFLMVFVHTYIHPKWKGKKINIIHDIGQWFYFKTNDYNSLHEVKKEYSKWTQTKQCPEEKQDWQES